MRNLLQFIYNIRTVAKYESKLLVRSWFFKIFAILAVIVVFLINMNMVLNDDWSSWMWKSIASNIPYANLLLLNIGQAVIAIFLASDFLKRDKQLDTSEVFYVRPLSNSEYVFGKIWGNIRVFLILNFIIIGVTLALNLAAEGTYVDWAAYGIYFLIITLPTLIFIMGLATVLMLTFKNQALTFIVLLGYIGVTIFYVSDKFYYVFDYMAYSVPLFKSTFVGFSDLPMLINHRAIYLFFGLSFIFFTIFLFRRLPNSSFAHIPWMVLSVLFFGIGGSCAYIHVTNSTDQDKARERYIELNNEYASSPKMVIDDYKLSVKQYTDSISAEATIIGTPIDTAKMLVFCLNPGMNISEVSQGGEALKYERKDQMLLVEFAKELYPADTITLTIKYAGVIDEAICYLDIPEEELNVDKSQTLITVGKKYSFLTEDYLMVTPETIWYPRPGTAFSDESPDWLQAYFTNFTLEVDPLEGLVPISQGIRTMDSLTGIYLFTPDYTAQTLSLLIGNYKQKSVISDSVIYSVHYLDGHDYFSATFDSIYDTIPALIKNMRGNIERNYRLTYPFKRFSLVEVPGQFKGFPRAWSGAEETVQPEMVFIPEKGFKEWGFDFKDSKKWQFRMAGWNGREISEKEAQAQTFNSFLWRFYRTGGSYSFTEGSRGRSEITQQGNPYGVFPMLYNFRYNIYSTQWTIANRAVELYLLDNANQGNDWTRQYTGISSVEKANLLLADFPMNKLLGDVEHRTLTNDFVTLATSNLFAEAEINAGVAAFRDSLYMVLNRNSFKNLQFEKLLDTLGVIGKSNIHPYLEEWKRPTPLPQYTIGEIEVKHIKNKDAETFVLVIEVSNDSDNKGVIQIDINMGGGNGNDPKRKRKIIFKPNESKRLVSHWESAPRGVTINTLVSENLPNFIYQPVANVEKLQNVIVEPEGDHIVTVKSMVDPNEIIVDNEDSLRFSVTTSEAIGMLPGWLDRFDEYPFKYEGLGWGWSGPLKWTATTNQNYYGDYIRSAYVIKSGDGSQVATWRVPIKEDGKYDAYYYISKDDYIRWSWRARGQYHFTVAYGEDVEDVYIDVKRSIEGWKHYGVYDFKAGEIVVTLDNETELRNVVADAVRFVKR